MTTENNTVSGIRHPYYKNKIVDWEKWRLTYDGGPDFVERYLEKYSRREDDDDFKRRKRISPTPNFAKSAVNDIKNSIFQRLADVSRAGGDPTYQKAVEGDLFGVDLHGSSMNSFIGRQVLPELLSMSRIGVFVDMPIIEGTRLSDTIGIRPYMYSYRAEDILSWSYRPDRPDEFDNLLLRDYVEIKSGLVGLPTGVVERFRYVFIGEEGKVHVRFYQMFPSEDDSGNKVEKQVDQFGNLTEDDIILDLEIIPFEMMELSDSLLADISNHQIALLNMESSDIAYALLANFPFYVEQDDGRDASPYADSPGQGDDSGTAASARAAKDKEIQVGATQGRRYGKNLDAPSFIHPSSEPLKASMEKQQQLKDDVRQLVNLALSNIKPKMASAESKAIDERGLEAGLSYIGLVLEHGERKLARFWSMYLKKDQATIKYPEKYSLMSEEDRRKDTEMLGDLRSKVTSPTFQKQISIRMADTLIGHTTPTEMMETIRKEILESLAFDSDPDTIFDAIDRGVLDLATAEKLLGYPPGTAEKAKKDHAERLARISEAQSKGNEQQDPAARGVGDLSDTPGQGSTAEKAASRDTTQSGDTRPRVRGEAD